MKIRGMLVAATLTLGLSGCNTLIEAAVGAVGLPSPSKTVVAKASSNVLLARDGSTCKVPEPRYEIVRVGDSVTCVWTDASIFAVERHTP